MIERDNYYIGNDKSVTGKIDSPNVIIMDKDTGTEKYNTHYSEGLHLFLQLKHGCDIGKESLKAIFMSNIRYINKYGSNIYGLSGTLGSQSEREVLTKLYNVDFARIPSFKPSQFMEDFTSICENREQQRTKIHQVADEILRDGRPVLIITENLLNVDYFYEAFKEAKYDVKKYRHSYDKLDVFQEDKGLRKPCVILATNLAGRGSDLKISEKISKAGGLHVILTDLPNNKRIEEQAFGRAARKGHNGSGQLIIIGSQNKSNIAKLKARRDEMESARIGKMHKHYQTHIKVEEKLLDSFIAKLKRLKLDRNIDRMVSLSQQMTPESFLKGLTEVAIDNETWKIFEESFIHKWAFFLDSVQDLLGSSTKDDAKQLELSLDSFLKQLKVSGDLQESIPYPNLKLQAG